MRVPRKKKKLFKKLSEAEIVGIRLTDKPSHGVVGFTFQK